MLEQSGGGWRGRVYSFFSVSTSQTRYYDRTAVLIVNIVSCKQFVRNAYLLHIGLYQGCLFRRDNYARRIVNGNGKQGARHEASGAPLAETNDITPQMHRHVFQNILRSSWGEESSSHLSTSPTIAVSAPFYSLYMAYPVPLSLLNIVEQCRRVSNSVSQYQPSTKKAGPTKKTVYVAEIFGKMSRNAISFSKGYCGIPVNYFHWRRRDETLG